MPPKGSKKKTKAAKEEQPPLPEEQPPLPEEQPPLPTEQPPLPEENPPLPDEQPPRPDEQPPLPEEQPQLPEEDAPESKGQEQPPLPDEQPPLPDEQPPLPDEQPPLPNEQPPLPNEPIPEPTTSGATATPSSSKGKGKDTSPHPWQAVWSAERSAWYFWNTATSEVTWTNPLAPPSQSTSNSASPQPPLPNEPAPTPAGLPHAPRPKLGPGGVPEIDPGLAHLIAPEQRDATSAALSAAFTARTGRAGADYGYSFSHLDEYNRAKRFSEHYFDVEGWERQKAAESLKRQAEEAAGVSRETKITKKDMDRFRAKQAEKKQRRRAWLYD